MINIVIIKTKAIVMKRTIIFISLLLFAVIYFNCNSSTTSPGNTLTSISTISGKIQSWTLGNKTLKVLSNNYTLLTSTNIDNSGNFTINFPANVQDSLLYAPFPGDSNCAKNINLNPSDLKDTYIIFGVYEDSNLLGYVYKEYGNQLYSGYIRLEYFYYNNSGSFNGTENCNRSGLTENATFSVSFPKGWYYEVLTIDSSSYNYIKYHVNSTEPSGLTWDYQPLYDKYNPDKYFKK